MQCTTKYEHGFWHAYLSTHTHTHTHVVIYCEILNYTFVYCKTENVDRSCGGFVHNGICDSSVQYPKTDLYMSFVEL